MFDAFDEDRSGFLEFKELSLVLALDDDTHDKHVLNFVFKMFDSNRDGKISLNEFRKVIKIRKYLLYFISCEICVQIQIYHF